MDDPTSYLSLLAKDMARSEIFGRFMTTNQHCVGPIAATDFTKSTIVTFNQTVGPEHDYWFQMSFDNHGQLIICWLNMIIILNSEHKPVRRLNVPELKSLHYAIVIDQYFYLVGWVAGTENKIIGAYELVDDKLIQLWSHPINGIVDYQLDSDQNLVVFSDHPGYPTVTVISRAGVIVRTWDPTADSTQRAHRGLVITPEGNYLVTDDRNESPVRIFRPTGELLCSYGRQTTHQKTTDGHNILPRVGDRQIRAGEIEVIGHVICSGDGYLLTMDATMDTTMDTYQIRRPSKDHVYELIGTVKFRQPVRGLDLAISPSGKIYGYLGDGVIEIIG